MKFFSTHKQVILIIVFTLLPFLLIGGIVSFALVNNTSMGLENTEDAEHESSVRELAKVYANAECIKSYNKDDCKDLSIEDASYNCGFQGLCGWTINIYSSKEFNYSANIHLEKKGILKGYSVTSYTEADSPYTKKISSVFEQMCNEYSTTRAVGCDPLYLESSLDWLGGNSELPEDSPYGVATSSVGPYLLKGMMNRDGSIKSATIINRDEDVDIVLFKYQLPNS
jgi:hypothetical protein